MLSLRNFFTNITPLFLLTFIGLILCLCEMLILFFEHDHGGLAQGMLSLLATTLFVIFKADRFLVKKLKYKTLMLIEIGLLLISSILYLYFNNEITINVKTRNQYLVVLFDNKGISKNQIPLNSIFDRSLTISTDSILNLNYKLIEDYKAVKIYPNWDICHSAHEFDTIINSEKIHIEMYSHCLSILKEDSIFKKKVKYIINKQTKK